MTRRFGVEIEAKGLQQATVVSTLGAIGVPCIFSNYGSQTVPTWKVQRDGSLGRGGYELVSPPMVGTEGLEEVRKVVQAIARKTRASATGVDRTCGLHIHVEMANATVDQFKRLIKSYANNEDVIDSIMPESRRANRNYYTGSLYGLTETTTPEQRVQLVTAFFQRVDACTSVNEIAAILGTRYKKLNLYAYMEHGTVEFRHHSGTIEADKVCNWARFCDAFVNHAVNAKVIRPWGVNKMTQTARMRTVLQMLKLEDLYPYYRDRIRELR